MDGPPWPALDAATTPEELVTVKVVSANRPLDVLIDYEIIKKKKESTKTIYFYFIRI